MIKLLREHLGVRDTVDGCVADKAIDGRAIDGRAVFIPNRGEEVPGVFVAFGGQPLGCEIFELQHGLDRLAHVHNLSHWLCLLISLDFAEQATKS